MRRITARRIWRGYGLLVLAGLVIGCGSEQSPDKVEIAAAAAAAAAAAVLPDLQVETLIQGNVEFAKPLTVELMTGVESPTSRVLAAGGFVEAAASGRAEFVLTRKGRDHGLIEWEAERGRPFLVVPVGHLELVQVTSNVRWERTAPARRVEFLYRPSPSEIGRMLLESGSRIASLQEQVQRRGEATLVRHAEGWRVHSLAL